MINTSSNIEDAIKFLNNQDVENLELQFKYQKDYFNSQDYNYTLINIERNLNVLYEKARVLQDVITYAREYIKQNVYSITDECKDILSAIEDNVDSLKQNNYININVPFLESTGSYTDRDNKALPKYAIYDSTISLSGQEKEKLRIKSISQKNNFKPYKENIANLIEDKPYRSFYMLDAPIKDGLREQIHVEFETENIINQLSIITSNSKVSDVKYTDSNGTIDYVKDHANVVQSKRKTKSLDLTMTTETYKKIVYYIDQARLKPNFWDSIMEHEYSKLTTGKGTLTQGQIDEISGLNTFKKDYEDYVARVEDWIKRREQIVKINESNGYTDSVPKIDFIVPPSQITGKNEDKKEPKEEDKQKTYQPDKVVQEELYKPKKPNVYPDSERYKYQAYNKEDIKVVDKTGNKVDYFMEIGKPKTYSKSYQRK